MAGIIGAAEEFWRVRITRVDAAEGLDFEYHTDILYRRPSVDAPTDVETWHVEALELEPPERVMRLASFEDRVDAELYLERAGLDLAEMTKAQFEEAYVFRGPAAEGSEESGPV